MYIYLKDRLNVLPILVFLNELNKSTLRSIRYINMNILTPHKALNKTYLVTDLNDWFMFDENEFERYIYGNKKDVKDYKQHSPSADTRSLEAEIDEMVYALYGLTEEKRKIVEEGVAPARDHIKGWWENINKDAITSELMEGGPL